MDKPLDELLLILGLVHLVATQVAAAQDRLNKFDELTRGLAEVDLDQVAPDEDPESPTVVNTLVADLESRKLDLVMAIQKQQYLGDKIDEIVGQNQDIVDTVREYFQLRDQITVEERDYAQRKLKYYQIVSIDPAIEYMDNANRQLHGSMTSVRKVVESATKKFTSNVTTMNGDYNTQVLDLIKEMNNIFRLIDDCSIENEEPSEIPLPKQLKRDLLILPLDRPLSISSIPSPTISLDSLESSDLIGLPKLPHSLLDKTPPRGIQLRSSKREDNPTESVEIKSARLDLSKAINENQSSLLEQIDCKTRPQQDIP